jgi:hypothetical protein
VFNRKPNKMANNGLKYQRIDPEVREASQREWNRPVVWPLLLALAVVLLALVPAFIGRIWCVASFTPFRC